MIADAWIRAGLRMGGLKGRQGTAARKASGPGGLAGPLAKHGPLGGPGAVRNHLKILPKARPVTFPAARRTGSPRTPQEYGSYLARFLGRGAGQRLAGRGPGPGRGMS